MSSPADDILVIKNRTLIDDTGGRPRPNGRIGIRGGKIAEVGPEAPSDQGGGGGFSDAAGRFILLGLIGGACPTVDVPWRAAGDRLSDERRILHAMGGPEPDADPPRGVRKRLGTRRRVVRRCDAVGRGEQRCNVPSDPAAETRPKTLLRRSSETARAQAVIANEEAVHDKATPIIAPDSINDVAPPAVAMTTSPTA